MPVVNEPAEKALVTPPVEPPTGSESVSGPPATPPAFAPPEPEPTVGQQMVPASPEENGGRGVA